MLVRLALRERSPEPTLGNAWREGDQLSFWHPHLKCIGIYGNPRPAITPLSGALGTPIYQCISGKSGGSAGRVDQLILVTWRVPKSSPTGPLLFFSFELFALCDSACFSFWDMQRFPKQLLL